VGGLLVGLFIEAGEGQNGVGGDIMVCLYESEGVINVGYGGVVEDDRVVIVREVAFAHWEVGGMLI
jgi:hypothetical protein